MTIGSYITIAWSAILFLVWNYLYGDLNENFSQATALVCLGAIFVKTDMKMSYNPHKGKYSRYFDC